MTTASILLPPKLIPVFSGDARYRGAYGGRGSGKTFSFAKMTAVHGYKCAVQGKSGQLLCCREHLNSLDESSLEEVKTAIRSEPWLNEFYEIGERYVRSKCGNIKYTFSGLRHNVDSVKSKAKILLAWVDEAEPVSDTAWRKLIPTVREDDSEIWVTWNPESPESPTHKRFRESAPDDSKIVELNWSDNPFFTDVLEKERKHSLKTEPDFYQHIWEGDFLTITDAQIFKNKFVVQDFEALASWDGPYYGCDWGFAKDPTALVKLHIGRTEYGPNCLIISEETGGIGVDTVDLPSLFTGVSGADRHLIRADSARPETISHMNRMGYNVEGASKWKGSVEDGIAFLRSFDKIVIHSRCVETAREARLYSYKIDKQTEDILPVIVDKNNHYIDAVRYGLTPMIQRKQGGFRTL